MPKIECDILVIGAGISGISAALTSSRMGYKTIQLERSDITAGVVRTALLNELCGLYLNDTTYPPQPLNSGIAKEICQLLYELEKQKPLQKGKLFVLPFSNNLFTILDKMINNAENLSLLKLHEAQNVIIENNIILNVSGIKNRKSPFNIFPKAVIDCSGDGTILTKCKQKLNNATQKQLSAISFKLTNQTHFDNVTALQIPYSLRKAVENGEFPSFIKFTTATRGIDGEIFIKINIDSKECSYKDGLGYIKGIHNCLKNNIRSLSQTNISEISTSLSHREGARLHGKYILTVDDVLTARKFKDGCVKNSWPIEYWDPQLGPKLSYLTQDEYYEIPERCLQAVLVENLYAAGRCISATPEALASARVSATSISTGEQAALLAIKNL